MSSEENLKAYRGNCHCGAIIYEARLPEITSYSECNCSICRKKGYTWVRAAEGQLDIVKGSIDELASYSFNNGRFVHHFCHNCGTAVFARNHYNPSEVTTAINVSKYAGNGRDVWAEYCLHTYRCVPSRVLTFHPLKSSRRLHQNICCPWSWLTV